LRTADAHALLCLDLGAQPRDRPVAPVGHRRRQQRRDHTQSRFALHRSRPRCDAGLQRIDAAVHKGAAPQAHRVFAHPERLGDPGAGPAGQRQQYGAGTIRFAALAGTGQDEQAGALFLGGRERRFASHVLHLPIGAPSESDFQALVNPAESA
jgi:hypothetical protein